MWFRENFLGQSSKPRRRYGRAHPVLSSARRNHKPQVSTVWKAVGAIVMVVLALSVLSVISGRNSNDTIAIKSSNLCPANDKYIVGRTFVHIDLTEPLNRQQRAALQAALRSVAVNLKTRERLIISQMQTDFAAPRKVVQDFCSPDISRISTAGKSVTRDQCPAIIAGGYRWARSVGEGLRQQIRRACEAYQKLQSQVVVAAERYAKVNVEQKKSYIIGGIEDVMHAANGKPINAPARLILFSDMLQNADWFSQYRTASDEWTIERLKDLRIKTVNMGELPDNNLSEVLICYLPSAHRALATAKSRNQHYKMWDEYFGRTKVFESDADGCAIAAAELMQ